MNQLRSFIHFLTDKLTFALLSIEEIFVRKDSTATNEEQSDSQKTKYEKAVAEIATSPGKFKKFRRIFSYRLILEHVSFSLGQKYLRKIQSQFPEALHELEEYKFNDLIGKPRRYKYKSVGKISPTTLRYICIGWEIKSHLGSKNNLKIAEIGIGYGGQYRILDAMGLVREYHPFDLPDVIVLSRKYLSNFECSSSFQPSNTENFNEYFYDLVISNYAFSELPRDLQTEYLNQVILKSKAGFMLMNSGRTNETKRNTGKLSLAELIEIIPNLNVDEEVPLTGPDNYLLTWGF